VPDAMSIAAPGIDHAVIHTGHRSSRVIMTTSLSPPRLKGTTIGRESIPVMCSTSAEIFQGIMIGKGSS
jgi:hypothetical protein